MPGMTCAIASCKKNSSKGLGYIFHNFPKDDKTRQDWIRLCNRTEGWNPRSRSICSVHFTEEDYRRDLRNELLGLPIKKILKPTAVPSLFLGIESVLLGASSSQRQINEVPMELLPEEKVVIAEKNKVISEENQVIAEENGVISKENEVFSEENEVFANKNAQNSDCQNDNYYQRKYEILLASHKQL